MGRDQPNSMNRWVWKKRTVFLFSFRVWLRLGATAENFRRWGKREAKRRRLRGKTCVDMQAREIVRVLALAVLLASASAQQCPIGHRCHPEATCSLSPTASLGYTCVCGTGFLGNGFECFTVSSVAAGGFHTCAVISDGTVKCWGSNSNGQLGDGTNLDRALPVNVTNIIPAVSGVSSGDVVRSLSLGQRHSCACMLSGSLQCWGSNSNGQLGTGDTVDKLTATAVKGLASAVTLVACGSRHTCVKLRGTNRILCFGLNDFGQSAQAISAPSSVPVSELRFIDNAGKESFASTIGVGEQHSCIHTRQTMEVRSQQYTDHKVYCWGFNLFGELGDGTFISRRAEKTILNWPTLDYDQTAIQVKDAGRGVRAVVSGHHNTCLLANAPCAYGDLSCAFTESQKCSAMFYRQSIDDVFPPQIAKGQEAQCVLYCWGHNQYGQLADPSFFHRRLVADAPHLMQSISVVSVGYGHICAIQYISTAKGQKGLLYCSGRNSEGQVASGTTTLASPFSQSNFGLVAGLSWEQFYATDVSAGGYHTCTLVATERVNQDDAIQAQRLFCWGLNYQGQVGDGSTTNRNLPSQVRFDLVPPYFAPAST